MTGYERLELRRLGIEPTTQACINCKHFYRHYRKDGYPFHLGHCAYPRMKNRETLALILNTRRRRKR